MKRVINIDGKEYELMELDKIVNTFIFMSVVIQVIMLLINTLFLHNVGISCFALGMSCVLLCLAIVNCLVSRHNYKIFRMVIKKIEEEENEEEKKNVKKAPKKPRKNVKKETKDGAK